MRHDGPHAKEARMAEDERTIRLDQFLKWKGMVATGGQAKMLIQGGQVQVNGQVETRRGRQLREGDVVTLDGQSLTVQWEGA
jgi:ribosome-associated protein